MDRLAIIELQALGIVGGHQVSKMFFINVN